MQNNTWLIIQAGGLGTRMRPLTLNRPKCLVPVGGETILSNAVKIFGDRVIVIGDYLIDVLQNYVDTFFPNVKVVKAIAKGTCAGLPESLSFIGEDEPFIFMWSDLFFEKAPQINFSKTTIGISRTFPCRYQYEDASYQKVSGNSSGIAGFFSFPNKSKISLVPNEGSFVGDFLKNSQFIFDESIWLDDTYEIGTFDSLKAFESSRVKSRFFNKVVIMSDRIQKIAKDDRFSNLISNEIAWYKKIHESFVADEVPKILSESPFEIELRTGSHPYILDFQCRKSAMLSIAKFFKKIHTIDLSEASSSDLKKMYFDKTLDRVIAYQKLINCFDDQEISINEIKCTNPFASKDGIQNIFNKIECPNFCIIHGDLTFSNCLWDSQLAKISIFDPRGKFGDTLLLGDPAYDWAKLYYSAVDGYDVTNTRDFEIKKNNDGFIIPESSSQLDIEFWKVCPFDKNQILIRLSMIWFSLIGYAENDIDTMNLAFLKGCFALKDVKSLF